ncbi:MAG: anthranilate phosphoribosyltransferase, partial [Gammaproteobacteria bacterium]
FLEIAGINIELTPEQVADCVDEFGIGFMYAPNLHSAMRHVMPARRGTGVRTIFNLLGPLTNPAGAKRQVLGVFDKNWVRPMAEVSKHLGQKRVMVIHSQDGLDEISIAAPTEVVELEGGFLKAYTIDPREFAIHHDSLDPVRVDGAAQSLDLIKGAFSGQQGPAYDMIALNSAAILQVSAEPSDFASALAQAKSILDNGEAQTKLAAYAAYTQSLNAGEQEILQ